MKVIASLDRAVTDEAAVDIGRKITVCLLTYNHAHLIDSTISSILDQTVSGHEVIISDDCSKDGTWERVLHWAARDNRIRPLRTPANLGMAANANFAVAQAKREYVALLHHDDLYRIDLLEQWAAIIEKYADVNFVFNAYDEANAAHTYGERFTTERIEGRFLLERFLFRRWGCPIRGTALIRRAAWLDLGGLRLKFDMLADVDLWMRLSALGAVGYVAEPLITPRHVRPEDYPSEYKESHWSWPRLRYLYEIHATNRLEVWHRDSLAGRLKWLGFRSKLSWETAKWLCYAVVRRKSAMIAMSHESATEYDLWPLRLLRALVRKLYGFCSRSVGESKT